MTEWATWIAVALSAASLLYSLFRGQSKHTSEKFRNVELKQGTLAASVDLIESRVTVVENEITHLPDKEVTHRLELALAGMQAEMRELNEGVKPLKAMANRIQEAMIEKVMS